MVGAAGRATLALARLNLVIQNFGGKPSRRIQFAGREHCFNFRQDQSLPSRYEKNLNLAELIWAGI